MERLRQRSIEVVHTVNAGQQSFILRKKVMRSCGLRGKAKLSNHSHGCHPCSGGYAPLTDILDIDEVSMEDGNAKADSTRAAYALGEAAERLSRPVRERLSFMDAIHSYGI